MGLYTPYYLTSSRCIRRNGLSECYLCVAFGPLNSTITVYIDMQGRVYLNTASSSFQATPVPFRLYFRRISSSGAQPPSIESPARLDRALISVHT